MTGADRFIAKNFTGKNVIFDSCMQSIIHGYQLLEKSKKYSRADIARQATKVRGKKSKIIELEDFLRNDLVNNYISPHRSLFGLQNYIFIPGAEESSSNIKTGVLDIKVCSPSFDGTVYYIFECKRLNKQLINSYIKEGVLRFIDEKYYPETETPVAGMISFLESTNTKSKIEISQCFNQLASALKTNRTTVGLVKDLENYKLTCNISNDINDFKFIFLSQHIRIKKRISINLYHIALDYNHIVLT